MTSLDESIRSHLYRQYEGIFTRNQIENHIVSYVQDEQSNSLITKIKPFFPKGTRILDIGCGYGSFVIAACKYGYEAHGIEIEKFEHACAIQKASLEGIDSARFTHGSALALPYEDEFFDGVTFWNVLEHISDFKGALREAKRVLKPSGKLFIIAPNYMSFRMEAHYGVPWLPLFPKSVAGLYLRLLGRNPAFLNENIFYVTNPSVIKFLKGERFEVTTDTVEKIVSGTQFKNARKNAIIDFTKKMGLLPAFLSTLLFLKTHPFSMAIDVLAKKS